MISPYLTEIISELKASLTQKDHPFKLCILSTIDEDYKPQSRIVRIRNISDDLTITFYSDTKSNKVVQLKKSPDVSLLFYNHLNRTQITITGFASISNDQILLDKKWDTLLPKKNQENTSINDSKIETNKSSNNIFLKEGDLCCSIDINPTSIEYLKIKDSSHFKVVFNKHFHGWTSEFLVP